MEKQRPEGKIICINKRGKARAQNNKKSINRRNDMAGLMPSSCWC